ncbi:N-acetyltransferase [Nocardioides sp. LS1]|nr:N-acetyltransferase [Nocardioides sp. LS1]
MSFALRLPGAGYRAPVLMRRRIDPAELRDLEPWHAEELAAFFRRSGTDLYDWLPWEHFESSEATKGFLESFSRGRADDTRRLFGIWLDDVLVGGTLFPSINLRAGTAEIGVFLAREARGQGIVTRAVESMVDWAFGERGLRRVEWRCSPGNLPSRAIPQRLGFTHEGTLRQAFPVREDFHDLEVWALLRDEWRP